MNKFNDPFRLEEYRQDLAFKDNLNKLKETYNPRYPEIAGLNTGDFWDAKFKEGETKLLGGMDEDRLQSVVYKLRRETGKLLDVGFGRGDLEILLQNSKLKIYGIDISEYAVKRARKYIKGTFQEGSILKISFPKEYFDVVVALEVLEHLPPPKTFKALSEMKRVLKKRGLLIISIPLNEGLEEMMSRGENPNKHARIYSPELIEAELKITNFEIEEKNFLYAFKDLYRIKKFLQKTFFPDRWYPNDLIIYARK